MRIMIWDLLNTEAHQELKKSVTSVNESLRVETPTVPHPFVFLSYSELVNSLSDEDKSLRASSLFNHSLRLNTPSEIEIVPWGASKFSPPEWELLLNSMATEAVFPRDLQAPTDQEYNLSVKYLDQVKADLRGNSPEYLKLLTSTLNTIVLAEPGKLSKSLGLKFGGATYFFFWGGTIINSQNLRSYYHFYEQLIHESCHMALFMLCSKYGILCTNPDVELHQSALRRDSGRPMHGIIHAYFVTKNLSECFKHIPHISEQNRKSSELLYKEISTYANLTKFGEFILETPEVVYCDSLVESFIESNTELQ